MDKESAQTRIVIITGPESTGKTELAKDLAHHYKAKWEPELARNYVQNLSSRYTYSDVEEIAKLQIEQIYNAINSEDVFFFDTGLIITKVWFDIVFKKCPEWLDESIQSLPKFTHLLCDIDLPWRPDHVRENGGEMRVKLFEIYKLELENYEFDYKVVSGQGKQRLQNAIDVLK